MVLTNTPLGAVHGKEAKRPSSQCPPTLQGAVLGQRENCHGVHQHSKVLWLGKESIIMVITNAPFHRASTPFKKWGSGTGKKTFVKSSTKSRSQLLKTRGNVLNLGRAPCWVESNKTVVMLRSQAERQFDTSKPVFVCSLHSLHNRMPCLEASKAHTKTQHPGL